MRNFYGKYLNVIFIGMVVFIVLAASGMRRGSILVGIFTIYAYLLVWVTKKFKLSWWMTIIVGISAALLMRIVLQYLVFKGWM